MSTVVLPPEWTSDDPVEQGQRYVEGGPLPPPEIAAQIPPEPGAFDAPVPMAPVRVEAPAPTAAAPPMAPTPPPVAPMPAGPDFSLLDTGPLTERLLGNIGEQRGRATERATTMAPQFESVRRGLDEMSQKILATAGQLQPPETPPVPVLTFHDFLAPTKNETPENAIGKVIQALGLIGGGFRGMMRGDATTALAGMKGALEGWAQGDTDRANRDLEAWKAASKRIEDTWQRNVTAVNTWMNAANLSLQNRVKGLELSLLESGLQLEPLKLEQQGLEYMLKEFDRVNQHVMQYQIQRERIEEMRRLANERLEERDRYHRGLLDMRQQGLDLQKVLYSFILGPSGAAHPAIDFEAKSQLYGNAPNPAINRHPAMAVAVLARRAELGNQSGGVEGYTRRQLDMKELRSASTKYGTQIATAMPRRMAFENHIRTAKEILDNAGASGIPLFNKWLMQGRSAAGDPTLMALDSAMQGAAREYGYAITGSGVTTDSSRSETSKFLNAFVSPRQFDAVVSVMEKELAGTIDSWEQFRRYLDDKVAKLGAGLTGPPTAAKEKLSRTSPQYKRLRDRSGMNLSDAQIQQKYDVELSD